MLNRLALMSRPDLEWINLIMDGQKPDAPDFSTSSYAL